MECFWEFCWNLFLTECRLLERRPEDLDLQEAYTEDVQKEAPQEELDETHLFEMVDEHRTEGRKESLRDLWRPDRGRRRSALRMGAVSAQDEHD